MKQNYIKLKRWTATAFSLILFSLAAIGQVSLDVSYYTDPTDAADFSVTATTTWDADSIYVVVNVTDDVLDNAHTNSWERDMVELYFDIDNSKIDAASGYDANDYQLGFIWNTDNSGVLSGAARSKQSNTTDGWMIDIAVPWSALDATFVPAEGTVIGFDVQAIDNDGANRESKLAMMALADQGWTNPAYMGELTLLAAGATSPIYPTMLPWSGNTAVPMNISYYTDPTDAADFSATSRTRWDMDSIYILVDVTDDVLDNAHANSWERDMVEVYFDMDNSKQDGAYDANDVQLGFIWNTDNSGVLSGATRNKQMDTDKGWSIEIAIAWESLEAGFVPSVDMAIGFDVQAIDNDGANRESKLATMALGDEAWHNTAYMGTMNFLANGQTSFTYPAYKPWSGITAYALENSFYDDPADAADFSVTAKMRWDATHINVLVDVTDDVLDNAHANSWERDMVELYFDMDNSKQDGAYDDNDVQLGFIYDTDNSGVLNGATTNNQWVTDNGWSIEISIPWDSLMMDFVPAVDGIIGFDVQAIDNDGANRESKLSLMALGDEAWQNTSYMGELQFLAAGAAMPIYKPVTEDVTFNVDMSGMIAAGLFVAGTNNVDIAGSFNNWGDPVMNLSDDDSDGIYSITVSDIEVGAIAFKCRVDGMWDPNGISEFPNGGSDRSYTVVEGDNVVDIVFNDGDYMPWLEMVTFNVDMSGMIDAELFVAGTDNVDVAGSFNNWGDPVQNLSDDDNDGTYSLVVYLPQGDITFKCRVNGMWDPDGISEFPNGGADRAYTVVDGENTISIVFNDGDYSPWADAIEDMISSGMRVYPTVSSDIFTVEFAGTPGSIEVFSLTGKSVLHRQAESARETIQIEGDGVYILRLESEGKVKMVKIIKTK